MPSGPRSTIPTWSSPASSATAKPRPDRWPPLAFQQVPRPGHRRRGAADPAPQRLSRSPIRPSSPASPTRNWSTCSSATAGRPTSSRGTNRRRCIRRWPKPSIGCWSKSGGVQHDARIHGDTARPRWPMIVLRSPKGWTGPKFIDGLPVEGTFRAHQVPLSVSARLLPNISSSSRAGCGATSRKNSSTSPRPAPARTGRTGTQG